MHNTLVIDAHPDPDPHLVHALADAYAEAAEGHAVRRLTLAGLDFPVLRSPKEWMEETPPAAIADAQQALLWADHITLFYPLWLGDMPALLKAFLEQVMRPGFAFRYREGRTPEKLLKGRSARIVVTTGMPALVYKLFYAAHSVKSLERNILKFVGISPVERTILGLAGADQDGRQEWLAEMRELGRKGI